MSDGPGTLAIDIGGTGLKAVLLDAAGRMLGERERIDTPHPCPPQTLVSSLMKLTGGLTGYGRVSVGFPGVVREGRVLTAPHFPAGDWRGFPLAATLAERLGRPVRLLNDAEVQGLGIVEGRGLEVVLTLGTGVGSAVFSDGALSPHLELAHHPLRKGKTYNEYVGEAARRKLGRRKWNRRLRRVIDTVEALLHYDVLYLGGGNSRAVDRDLPDNVHLASNDAGLTGGIRLWDPAVWNAVPGRSAHSGFA
ncbi:MAG: ROK family protein [Reyranellaceae bacterium]